MSETYYLHGFKNTRGRSARGIKTQLMGEIYHNLFQDSQTKERRINETTTSVKKLTRKKIVEKNDLDEQKIIQPLEGIRNELVGFDFKTANLFMDNRSIV